MGTGESGGYDPHVELAKAAIRAYVTSASEISVSGGAAHYPDGRPCTPPGINLSALLGVRAGVFVTIHKKGSLRGCIGTISAVRDSVAEEIVSNAISACSRDPRFSPVRPEELADLTVGVDVLSEAEPVSSPAELDAARYGVIVSRGYRRGLLLPNLEGVGDVASQLRIALSKAGIDPSEKYRIERFEVVRHELGGAMGAHG